MRRHYTEEHQKDDEAQRHAKQPQQDRHRWFLSLLPHRRGRGDGIDAALERANPIAQAAAFDRGQRGGERSRQHRGREPQREFRSGFACFIRRLFRLCGYFRDTALGFGLWQSRAGGNNLCQIGAVGRGPLGAGLEAAAKDAARFGARQVDIARGWPRPLRAEELVDIGLNQRALRGVRACDRRSRARPAEAAPRMLLVADASAIAGPGLRRGLGFFAAFAVS